MEARLPTNKLLPETISECEKLYKSFSRIKSKQVKSNELKDATKALVKGYFENLKPSLERRGLDTSTTDAVMLSLIKATNSSTLTSKYKNLTKEIKRQLVEYESSAEYYSQTIKPTPASYSDQKIVSTLEQAVPQAAKCYRQVIMDLNDAGRESYRGTASEIRECLREVLDFFAPDADVASIKGFKIEQGTTKPTMRQKVHYILKNRSLGKTEIKTPEEATNIIDDGIAKLARATYDRGSLSAHTDNKGKTEIIQLKMYLDTVLCELLEIHS